MSFGEGGLRVEVELLFSGYYRGPATFLDTYTFLKLYPDGRWVFAEGLDPDYDFPGRIKALGVDQVSKGEPEGGLDDGGTTLSWGRYCRGQDMPALNCNNQVVGRLADALEETCGTDTWGRFQVEVVGPGQLKPTTHDVILTFVAEEHAEQECCT
ncbi:MAG: hypothetical protein K8R36_07155 [Planctomycetales bacterium]|nr:hypothetical protein [Planctomycetales bacterium]